MTDGVVDDALVAATERVAQGSSDDERSAVAELERWCTTAAESPA